MSKKIVQLNEEVIKGELKELVRNSVEDAFIFYSSALLSFPRARSASGFSMLSTLRLTMPYSRACCFNLPYSVRSAFFLSVSRDCLCGVSAFFHISNPFPLP